MEWLQQVVDSWTYTPYRDYPQLLWLTLAGTALSAIACYSIFFSLTYFFYRRPDTHYRPLLALFMVALFSCGSTLLARLWSLTQSPHWAEAWLTLFTGLIALSAAFACWWILPRALRAPGRRELQTAYQQLNENHRRLMESEQRYRLLLETAAEGVWMVDMDGNTLFANPAMREMLQVDSLEHANLRDFCRPQDLEQVSINLRRRCAGIRESHDFTFVRSDGTEIHTMVSAEPVRGPDGAVNSVLGLVTDITDRVQAETQLARLNRELESRVAERTQRLAEANAALAEELQNRDGLERKLRGANERLQRTVILLRQQTELVSQLNRLGDLMHAANDLREMMMVTARFCERFFNTSACGFYLPGENGYSLEFSFGQDLAALEPQLLWNQCWAIKQGKPHPVSGVHDSIRCGHLAELPGRINSLCLPLTVGAGGPGLLCLLSEEAFWSGDEGEDRRRKEAYVALAEHAAQAIGNLRLRHELQELSFRDPLTGVYNRRFMIDNLRMEVARCKRHQEPLALMIFDLDDFKQINDQHGHDVGDRTLRDVARVAQEHLRESDVLCRYGGEEFLVVMPGANAEQAMQRAGQILEAIRDLSIPAEAGEVRISASIGVATFPASGHTELALRRAADQAMYDAKARGKNRILLATACVTI